MTNTSIEPDALQNPNGDLIVTLCLDPAVAAQVRVVADRWGLDRLADAAADILLTGLISINSTARRT
ncbi:hypothetical protein ABS772_23680 [Methylorubrum podarium]|uniref:Uncharacterized protein n=1 Tax=Methylorubrum podarium TaxID=200476 RepID=A0ABV1QU35_9HYPH